MRSVFAVVCALVGLHMAQGAGTTVSPGCGTVPADIQFLLDSSGSVGSSNFQKQKDFVARFGQSFDIGPNNVQIGVTTFSTSVHNQFNMNKYHDKTQLVNAIHGIPYQSGNTHTDTAINYVNTNSFTTAAGDRDHVANIVIVMTDGRSNNKAATVAAAAKLHQKNIKVFAIGIGSGVDRGELEKIATDNKHVFTVSNFDALTTLQAELKKTACEIDGHWSKWGFWSPCSKTCGGGTHFRERTCSNPPPANGGKNCVGAGRGTETCNTKACPTHPPPTTTPKTTPAPTTPTTVSPGCGVVPADIVFILDSSGSVGSSNYQKMLNFVKTMAQGFDISPQGTEISVVTFSDKPHLEFHLNKYHDKQSTLNAISHVRYISGGTNTADALKYARQTSFTQANGARPNSAKIAIVITDGKSNSATATASEAQRLRNDGVTVFSVGVGSGPKTSELNAMATDPDNQHVFVVNNFDALTQIKGTLSKKACEVKATVAPTPSQQGCGAEADIVFLLDSSGSVGSPNFHKMLNFVKNVTNNFAIGPNDVQIGVDTFQTTHKTEFNMNQHLDKASLQAAISKIQYHSGSTHTGEAIRFMHTNSFTAAAGHRPNVPKIGIVVTDGNSNNRQLTISEADKARKDGITMFSVGVGHGINDAELKAIATDPDSQHAFRADNFDSLSSLKGLLSSKACEVSQPKPNVTKDCGAQADIIFNLDSSGSVGKSNFDKMLLFVKNMVKNFNISSTGIRVGLSIFSSRPYKIFNLNKYTDKQALMNAIDNVPYKSGGTNTGSALKEVYSKMFTQANGDRPGVPNIEIVITDGRSNNHPNTVKEAANTRQHGINVFSVGVGSGVSVSELNDIASDPDSAHVMTVKDFSKLSTIQAAFAAKACAVVPPTPLTHIPTAKPTPAPVVDPCQDNLQNCASYGRSSCAGQYQSWARNNCARYCGFCATAIPTIPPACVDKLADCKAYDTNVCQTYVPWATDNCRKFCGFCSFNAQGVNGYYGKCSYNGKTYNQGDTWSDGCAYDCTCDDAAHGQYSCYNKCPSYYNLPPQCTLTKKAGECCLQPVCNFQPTYHTTQGQTVGNVNGISTCKYNNHDYFQGQTWQVGCDYECQCVDAGAGMWSCQSRCAAYSNLPSVCHLQQEPGKCCKEPKCDFQQQFGSFNGIGTISGKGVGVTPTTPPPCVDKVRNCDRYQANMCSDASYRDWAKENCAKFCNVCNQLSAPSPTDKCVYKGTPYSQGQTWYDGCSYECLCENAKYGYYRCNNRCPDYVNLPLGCHMVKGSTGCCPNVQCDGNQGTFVGSSTVPNVAGGYPVPHLSPTAAPTPLGPGQTYAPGMAPTPGGPTLAPVPGQPQTPGLVPNLIPKQIDGCYVNGTLYQQGQRWTSRCDYTCTCDDGKTGRYRCTPKCPTFQGLPASCTLVDDSTDPCCKVPSCRPDANGQTVHIPIPSYGPGFSGYGLAKLPTQTVTGTNGPGTSGTGQVPSSFTGFNPSPTVTGGRNGCVYKGQNHAAGSTWDDGCSFKCQCTDGVSGTYRCTDRCPTYQNLPQQCILIQSTTDACCKIPQCSFNQTVTTPQPFFSRTTPASGGDFCVYKGSYYRQGETWDDGCSYKCRCEDARNKYYQCTDRCGRFDNVPLGCSYVADPKDPTCCRVPQCSLTGTQGSISGGQGQNPNPTGFIGSFTGYGRPPSAQNNPNISFTAYSKACIYKGQVYQQGQTWQDGCNYDCECTDAAKGMYRCTDRCPRYGTLPSNCHLIADINDRCCQKADCAPTAPGTCQDNRADCASYGEYACHAPYDSWAKDNCAKHCGLCGGSGNTGATTAPQVCEDKIPNCKDYGTGSCSGTFAGWANYNCRKTCNLCGGTGTGGTGTGTGVGGTGGGFTGQGTAAPNSGTCSDTIPNCSEFTRDSCVDPYVNWALSHCPKFCGLCDQLSGSANGTIGGGISGQTGQHSGFATAFPNSGFTGVGQGCYYKGQLYNSGQTWQDACDYNCTCTDGVRGMYNCRQLCAQYTQLPQGCILEKPAGECCSVPKCGGSGTGTQGGITGSGTGTGTGTQGGMTGTGIGTNTGGQFSGTGSGCLYKGTLYTQGQHFDDGCTYKCTCTDASRGYYTCQNKCVQWSLPSACHLNPPATGKCCKTPSCPAGYVLNYPPGYTEE